MTGNELRTWVQQSGFSYRAIAKLLGVSQATLYNFYSSEKPLKRVVVLALAWLGCEQAKAEVEQQAA